MRLYDTVHLTRIMGENLKKARKKRGYSQHRLTVVCGLGYSTIPRLERGEGASGQIQTWAVICNELGIRIEELMVDSEGGSKRGSHRV